MSKSYVQHTCCKDMFMCSHLLFKLQNKARLEDVMRTSGWSKHVGRRTPKRTRARFIQCHDGTHGWSRNGGNGIMAAW